METISKSLSETADLTSKILAQIIETKKTTATVLALYGDLGSGKTTFTQFLAKELGVLNYVTSPTFVIEKKYEVTPALSSRRRPGSRFRFKNLVHIDCYRLSNPDEMLHLGWAELITDPANLIVVEWPERIEEILPSDCMKIEFEFVDENTRKIALL